MIEASRCPACDRVAVPPEEVCLACGKDPQAATVGPEGTVLARTVVDGREVALVELEGGARVLATTGGADVRERVRVKAGSQGFAARPAPSG